MSSLKPPRPHPFLAAEAGDASASADALLLGLAADGGVSFRPGAAGGPSGIREYSEAIESWSPRAKRDLDDLTILDLGDHDDRETIEAVVAALPSGPLLVSIGGDHSVTPPVVRAVAARHEALGLIGFDAHLDLREDYPGDHACTYRRISDAGVPCHVFGVRSGARHEWDDVPRVLASCSSDLDVSGVLGSLSGRPVYVTIDIDVLDPSVAPGTGNPEPGGPGFNELLEAVEALAALNVVALDVVEVSPPLDPSGITQTAAAVLIREALLRFV